MRLRPNLEEQEAAEVGEVAAEVGADGLHHVEVGEACAGDPRAILEQLHAPLPPHLGARRQRVPEVAACRTQPENGTSFAHKRTRAERVEKKSSVVKHYGCKRARHCRLITCGGVAVDQRTDHAVLVQALQ